MQKSSRTTDLLLAAAAGAGVGVFVARNFFATEEKIRHRVTTEFGMDDPAFARTMSDLLGPPLLPGNRVTLLQNWDEIFPAMPVPSWETSTGATWLLLASTTTGASSR